MTGKMAKAVQVNDILCFEFCSFDILYHSHSLTLFQQGLQPLSFTLNPFESSLYFGVEVSGAIISRVRGSFLMKIVGTKISVE